MEKQRDNNTCGDYQDQSKVECDLKMESSAQESDINFVSTEKMIQTEQLLKEKEKEAEMWEQKYTEVHEELSKLKEKLSHENQNTFEVSLLSSEQFSDDYNCPGNDRSYNSSGVLILSLSKDNSF